MINVLFRPTRTIVRYVIIFGKPVKKGFYSKKQDYDGNIRSQVLRVYPI
jgi:hypothetical protein